MIRIGPAGWSYKDWAGIVYPQPKPRGFDPLSYLAHYFDTIEVNSTFYRPASQKTGTDWAARVEHNDSFRFTAKLWRRFTHRRGEAWTRGEVAEVRAAFDPLQDAGRLGGVLLQFPWSFRDTEENRSWLEDLVTAFSIYPLVVEVRHASWNHPGFLQKLGERGVGFVNIDQPLFRDSIAPSAHVTSPVGYVRVHGRNYRDWWRDSAAPHARYDYLYPAAELKPWAERALEIEGAKESEETYVVTNNHYRGKAVANALMLGSMITGEKVIGPEPLFAEFADVLKKFAEPGAPEEAHARSGG
jgi:uncharacterized protein YecE (DUF72 family)